MKRPSERKLHFCRLVFDCHKQLTTVEQLVEVVRNKDCYSVLLRVAALRNLVADAPIEVTRGMTYLLRRRAVRIHYAV